MEIFNEVLVNGSSIQVWVALLAGVMAGMIFGALPGLSATMGVALLIPFTFDLSIMPALALLIGVYCAAVYGGSIPAILFRTPGTPASAATIFDGAVLAARGEAGKALSVAALSALVGGVIGTLLLIALTPQISRFALRFGPPEYFALATFGLSMIVAISESSVRKGLIVAVFGLLISTVGMDPLTGYPRFIYGQASLMEGMPFIPALIGLFAIAEVLSMGGLKSGNTASSESKIARFPSGSDVRRSTPTILKSSFLGTFVGATPGAGSDIAAFLAYSIARQQAGKGDKFGEGEVKGVAAPEAAKTAGTAGAMIPLLALGLPGDSVTAVLIGAFILHGVQPGPLLFQDHSGLAYSIFATVLFAHILVFIVAVSGVRILLRVNQIDRRFLQSGILILSLVGAFALRNNLADVWLALAFGVLGYALRRGGYPVAPLLLALILGPLAEENLRRALILSGGDYAIFIQRPITVVLLLAGIAALFYGLIRRRGAPA
ncbi:tripartite tricarboxylate transporter permease [Coraliomargarita sp. SDUM461004]|uniref:Tripartite tricarboxylate transporter permease n=1 Tax=Thalassobacterium sedimentorum TaxID=3041258 RepID=A0ABU1AET3_9BACT|nr:tripartite tricarboxylate transporter permease [Coraliomargarita sp. SDUM461004]MDQ8193307.1 tripartite tricarboxylate transporter permease [Coraliomargarita sp. SDUM461004]